jgi:Flp pilus assembly protein TadD
MTDSNPSPQAAALERLATIAAAKPSDGALQLELGIAYLAAGRGADAEQAFRRAARLLRDSAQPRLGVAASLNAQGKRREAIGELRKLLHAIPSNADAWFNLGNFLRREREFDEAARAYRRVLALRADDEGACLNLSQTLIYSEHLAEAEAELRRFISTHGETPDLLCNLGQTLRYAKRLPEAEAALRRGAELSPSDIGIQFNLALTLSQAGDTESAERMLRAVPESALQYAEARAHLGEILLGTGRFAEGWREYRWRNVHVEREPGRWVKHDSASGPQSLDDLRGRHVIVKGEQGLGDVLFFLRFLSPVVDVASSVTLDLDPRLRRIIGERPPLRWTPPVGAATIEVLAGSLPTILCASEVAPPFPLTAEEAEVRCAREEIARLGPPPYIGLTWEAGTRLRDSKKPGAELHKRIEPEELAKALEGVKGTFVSLQRSPDAEDLERLRGSVNRSVADLGEINKDLPRLLGLLRALDEYVGVSNTNMHLLAGLGKTARVLIPVPPDWRWMRSGQESPWFAGFAVYRQAVDRSWNTKEYYR